MNLEYFQQLDQGTWMMYNVSQVLEPHRRNGKEKLQWRLNEFKEKRHYKYIHLKIL